MNFELTSEYQPTGDQPEAIRQLLEGIAAGEPAQTLLGVTGSGKTFTVANVVAEINRPTLVLSHNKTLLPSFTANSSNFSQIMRLNILLVTTTIISRKPLFQAPIRTSKRT